MSQNEENVEPGKVNNLISFFEHQSEDDQKIKHTKLRLVKSEESKPDVVNNYFGATKNYKKQSEQSCEVNQEMHIDNTKNEEYKKEVTHNAQIETEQNVIELNENYKQEPKKVPRAYLDEIEIVEKTSVEQENKKSDNVRESVMQQEHLESKINNIQIAYNCPSNETYKIGNETHQINGTQRYINEQEESEHLEVSDSSYQLHSTQVMNGYSTKELTTEDTAYVRDQEHEKEIHSEAEINYELKSTTSESEREQFGYDEETQCSPVDSEHNRQHIGFGHLEGEQKLDTEELAEQSHNLVSDGQYTPHTKEDRKQTPTVYAAVYWDPEEDCNLLKKAMKGLGTNEDALINILANRSTGQRLEIVSTYGKLFQKNLITELQKETSGHFEDLLVAMVTAPYYYLAKELRKAVKGLGTCEDTLIEILCIYGDEDISYIKNAYDNLFKRSLKDDVFEDTSGDFRKILLSILSSNREDPNASPFSVAAQLCETDAKGKTSIDSDTLRTVLVSYTKPFLYDVCSEYEAKREESFAELIKNVCSGDAQNALLALYRGVQSHPVFFAEEIHQSFKGLGTKDAKLIRIIVSRSEIDLEDIKEAFFKIYAKELEGEVKKETSGNYRNGLVALIQGCNKEDYRQFLIQNLNESPL